MLVFSNFLLFFLKLNEGIKVNKVKLTFIYNNAINYFYYINLIFYNINIS